jgi:hypothetical protein
MGVSDVVRWTAGYKDYSTAIARNDIQLYHYTQAENIKDFE